MCYSAACKRVHEFYTAEILKAFGFVTPGNPVLLWPRCSTLIWTVGLNIAGTLQARRHKLQGRGVLLLRLSELIHICVTHTQTVSCQVAGTLFNLLTCSRA